MTDETETLDYPVAAPDDIHPRIFRAMLIQHMGLRYLKSVPSIDLEYAMEAAVATWETDWDSDPKPRDFDDATDAVDSDLEHWEGD